MEIALRLSPLAAMIEQSRELSLDDPDAELMLRFKSGDVAAFDALFHRHVRSVVNYAFRFVRCREAAEEVAQEVFLRIHDAAGAYRPDAKFRTWLYRIATNVCLNEVRKPRFRAVHQSLDEATGEGNSRTWSEPADRNRPGPDTELQREAVGRALRLGLESLPEKQRIAFILNKYQELSYLETADVMKISEKAVKSLIHRAKEALAERLRPLLPELL